MVLFEDGREYGAAIPVSGKGSSDMIPERVTDWVMNLGYIIFSIKNDIVPSITYLQYGRKKYVEEFGKMAEEIRAISDLIEAQIDIIFEKPPAGEPQSNGLIESTIKQTQGQIRTIRVSLEI